MLEHLKIGNILFLDIETVPQCSSYQEMNSNIKTFWDKKSSYIKKEDEDQETTYQRAGIYAEFGKIICISTGMIGTIEGKRVLRLKSFFAPEEKKLLEDFAFLITRLAERREIFLCAHNGKEFDFPYISRRLLINGIELPSLFNISAKKPWEVRHLDTMELWKFGDHKHYTSLDLLAYLFEIESPKSDIDGSNVAKVYWKDNDINRIVEYCRRDVITVAQLILKFTGEELLKKDEIIVTDNQ